MVMASAQPDQRRNQGDLLELLLTHFSPPFGAVRTRTQGPCFA